MKNPDPRSTSGSYLASMADPSRLVAMAELGWDDAFAESFTALGIPGTHPGRVMRVDRGMCTVLMPNPVRITTRQSVAVGDWVAVGPGNSSDGRDKLREVLPRRSVFSRKQAGLQSTEQVVAAKIDTILLVNALDAPLHERGIERYLTLGWQSGATPVMVLTKADVCNDEEIAEAQTQVAAIAIDVDIHTVSAKTGLGIERLAEAFLLPGRTTALLGPSGAGKSTLVNRLANAEVMSVGKVREDDAKGRHTTTHRELVVLPGHGLLIDTPGMRELALWDADDGLAQTFTDIEELSISCRFADCAHLAEPGCAVRTAIQDGNLDEARLTSWQALQQELYVLASRQMERKATARNPKYRGKRDENTQESRRRH